MTIRTHKLNLLGRASILAALGAATLALVAASPANAIYRSYEPTDADEPVIQRTVNSDDTSPKKGCTLAVLSPDGKTQSTITYAHGYSFKTVNKATGKTHTYTCNNGTWEETVEATTPTSDYVYDADLAYVDGSATLVVVNPNLQYASSTDVGFYAEP